LIIKVNEKKSLNSPNQSSKLNENIEDPIGASDAVIINQNPVFFTNVSTKKSLKSAVSIVDKI
jgi:hypothetical protein